MKAISFMNKYKPFTNGYRLNRKIKTLANASAFILIFIKWTNINKIK